MYLALSVEHLHKSKIVGLCPITYSNHSSIQEELPDEVSERKKILGLYCTLLHH